MALKHTNSLQRSRKLCLNQSRHKGSAVVEFSVFCALVGFVLLPIFNMLGLIAGFGFSQMAAQFISQETAKAASIDSALANMCRATQTYCQLAPCQLLKISPVGGYQASGSNLYIVETAIQTGKSTYYNVVDFSTISVDTSQNIYEACVKSTFNVGPLVQLQYMSFIPGCGKPLPLNFSTFQSLQDPQALIASAKATNLNSSATGAAGLTGNPSDWLGQATLDKWYYPGNWNALLIPGQQISQSNVVSVLATNSNLTDSGLYAKKGSRILVNPTYNQKWIDHYQDLVTYYGDRSMQPINGFYPGMLIIQFGRNGQPFFVGASTSTLMVPNDGEVYFYCLDIDHQLDGLVQTVHVATTN